MQFTTTPDRLQPGDRFVQPVGDPEETWPVIAKVGKEVDDPDHGRCREIHLEGQQDVLLLPVDGHVGIDRRDDAKASKKGTEK